MLVKICGIKTKGAALAAAKTGAKFLGFNFVPTSKRLITPSSVQKIIGSLQKHGRPLCVGVFMDQPAIDVRTTMSKVKLDMLQFHGMESPRFCGQFGLPYIKAFSIGKNDTVVSLANKMKKYTAKYFMLDRQDRGKGVVIDLKKVSSLSKEFPILLAGGLTPDNVQKMVIKAGKIKGVDVAGGVEKKSIKSIKKIKNFIHNAI